MAVDLKTVIEIIAAATMPIAVCGVLIDRMVRNKGIGTRSIQFLAVAAVLPLILILSLENVLEKGAVAALIGSLIGYLLSNIGDDDKEKRENGKKP